MQYWELQLWAIGIELREVPASFIDERGVNCSDVVGDSAWYIWLRYEVEHSFRVAIRQDQLIIICNRDSGSRMIGVFGVEMAVGMVGAFRDRPLLGSSSQVRVPEALGRGW